MAVHTRRLADPERTFEALLPALEELAARYDLVVEPGKQVIEVRSPGMHKGLVVERLVDELHAGGFVFVGDDLGDLEAFEAVAALAERGLPTLLVCSASDEESALVRLSDVLVHGPEGVLDLLRQLTADAAALRALRSRARTRPGSPTLREPDRGACHARTWPGLGHAACHARVQTSVFLSTRLGPNTPVPTMGACCSRCTTSDGHGAADRGGRWLHAAPVRVRSATVPSPCSAWPAS